MGQVVVSFVGLCSFLNRQHMRPPEDALSPPDTNPGHYLRVIAVNGRFGARLADSPIPPHTQHLHIPAQFIDQADGNVPGLASLQSASTDRWWSMDGISAYVANAVPGITRSADYGCIPSLTDVSGQLSLELDPRVVLDGRAALQFQIYGGALDAYRVPKSNGAMVGKVTITTTGEQPELVVTRVWDQNTKRIRLKGNPAHVFVLNIGEGIDHETDFLLHYFVTTWTPPAGFAVHVAPHPYMREVAEEDGFHHLSDLPMGLTVGCSVSGYP